MGSGPPPMSALAYSFSWSGFSLRTPLNGWPSCLPSMNSPVSASRLVQSSVTGFST